MIRRIIKIDAEKCNGCGLCAEACHEGAIIVVDGKARLMRDDYCDGLGDCLPSCPTDAISFEEREAAAYDDAAVKANMAKRAGHAQPKHGCPGSSARTIASETSDARESVQAAPPVMQSQLTSWPVQIKLAPANAPYFSGANLLIAADCTAFAYADFHNEFMRRRITLIGCPKLDDMDYSVKLTQILSQNDIKSVTVVRMQVPCCGGLAYAVKNALESSGKTIPWQIVTISTDGRIIED